MRWNWQQADWPDFRWEEKIFAKAEAAFLRGAGVLVGSAKHLDENARQQLLVDAMSVEALTTSEIEGEILNRASVQSWTRSESRAGASAAGDGEAHARRDGCRRGTAVRASRAASIK